MNPIVKWIILIVLGLFFLVCGIALGQLIAKNNSTPAEITTPDTIESLPNITIKSDQATTIRVPILMYHYIRTNPDPNDAVGYSLSVTPENFKKQLDYLVSHNYNPITLDDLNNAFDAPDSLPTKPIILTFDDGYSDFYTTAFPELKARNVKATIYIIAGLIDDKDHHYLTWEQVRELDQSGLITIGDHSYTHANLATQNTTVLQKEIITSKSLIEKQLGHSIDHFCYPSGKWSPLAITVLEKAGFITATTTAEGSEHTKQTRLALPRLRVSGSTTIALFEEQLLTTK